MKDTLFNDKKRILEYVSLSRKLKQKNHKIQLEMEKGKEKEEKIDMPTI